ncbi:MAG: hypothetical protein EA370_01025 [Wenzhouxiangella sp.]|nr:MAG: hypothetical protein EA370_01025 [Wenzhouxiangella sp.]
MSHATPAGAMRLASLGVWGFDAQEPIVLAALVTEDPLLLIGPSGTGKTYLLNTLSEALRLEHRHYNASLISFDDLVGFPFPESDGTGVKFLETPATVWGAESVLIDEISRCKPEHQNRLFSLVHERRLQGIALDRLRYRWAAMNPCTGSDQSPDDYTGSEPLDPALADRFALFVEAADWSGLKRREQRKITDPSGEGRIADDGGALAAALAQWRSTFLQALPDCPAWIITYVSEATDALNQARIRISPRRARLMARSLLAATIVSGHKRQALVRSVLKASLPHMAWGREPDIGAVDAAHRLAWSVAMESPDRWIHQFLAAGTLVDKLKVLLDQCRDPDTGSQAVAQLLASENPARAAAFAFATTPAAVAGNLPLTADGVNDLARIGSPMLDLDGTLRWQERLNGPTTPHPELTRYAEVIRKQRGARKARASQFFHWCALEEVKPEKPEQLEQEIQDCVALLRRRNLS